MGTVVFNPSWGNLVTGTSINVEDEGNCYVNTDDGTVIVKVGPATPTTTVTSVTVSPNSTSVEKGQTQNFSATVSGTNSPSQSVTWNVSGGSASSIDASGVLSVGSGETASTLTVTATSTFDTGKSGSASVTVTTPTPTVTSVSVSPSTASVQKGNTQNFSATVSGTNSPSQSVTWSVSGGSASSIDASGVLTVGAGETATSLTVKATSVADNSKNGTATVSVTTATPSTPTVTSVSVSPSTASVQKGNTQNFSATVSGINSPSQSVTWSVSGGSASSIDASGVLTVGAGETATSLTVKATSVDDNSKNGTATVSVTNATPDAIETVANNNIEIYGGYFLTIKSQESIHIEVYNFSGGRVYVENVGEGTNNINLKQGIYIVMVQTLKGVVRQKLIIK
jgi:uncharacterized protein YjdB